MGEDGPQSTEELEGGGWAGPRAGGGGGQDTVGVLGRVELLIPRGCGVVVLGAADSHAGCVIQGRRRGCRKTWAATQRRGTGGKAWMDSQGLGGGTSELVTEHAGAEVNRR